MQKSQLLMLIIGSNTKQRGGAMEYDPTTTILTAIAPDTAQRLIDGRRRVLGWVQRGGVSRHGKRIAEMPANRDLVSGPDFGGTEPTGRYLPAAQRFRGRFYAQLGPDPADVLTNARHHVLILTGLYGLVLPSEAMQDHQCHVDDHPNFRKFWTDDDLLTEVLLSYIARHSITHVYDLTAKDSYRFLIAWERIRAKVGVVLHCFGEQSVGDELLTSMGALAALMLSSPSDEKWLAIPPGTVIDGPYERIYLQPSPKPPAGAPREIEVQRTELSVADELGRMRRCLIRILIHLGGDFTSHGRRGVQWCIDPLQNQGRIPPETAEKMKKIIRARNRVEYSHDFRPTEPFMERIRKAFSEVRDWAARKIGLPPECLDV